MSVKSTLGAGRKAHSRLFVDVCTITRATPGTYDSATASYTDPEPTTIYSGPARLKAPSTEPVGAITGEQDVTVRRYELDLPWDASGPVLPGDIATLTASDDAWAVGVPLTVLDAGLSGSTTARRMTVEARS